MASVTKREWTTPDGETKTAWVCRYTDQEGKRRLKTFEKKKEADLFRTETADQIERGVHIADREALTVKDVCRHYLQQMEIMKTDGRLGAGTVRNRALIIERRIVPFCGKVRFKDLTVQHVSDFYSHLVKTKGNSPRTAKERLVVFALVESFAIKRKFARVATVREGLRELQGIAPAKVKTFDIAQIGKVLQAVEERPARARLRAHRMMRAYVHLATFCGLRIGEISALRLEAVDFDNGEILISRSWSMIAKLKGPKSQAGNRIVPMPPHVAEMLREWLREHYSRNKEGFLFATARGVPPSMNALHHVWKSVLIRCGLWSDEGENLHFHALRHFFASLMIETNMPITDLSRIIGHASPNITMSIYAHSIKGRGRQNHDAIARAADLILLPAPAPEGAVVKAAPAPDATRV